MTFSKTKSFFVTSVFVFLTFTHENYSSVLPPSNVTVRCQNFNTIVHWSYPEASPHVYFRVKIHREIEYGQPQVIETKDQHCDVSSLITSIENSYFLEVQAVNGSDESSSSNSSVFSYDKYWPAQQQCELDFPAVNISIRGGKITVRFIHPLLLYKNMLVLRNMEKKYPEQYEMHKTFEYEIGLNKSTEKFTCNVQDVCKATIAVTEEREKYCVCLRGRMKNTVVRSSEQICSHKEPEDSSPLNRILYGMCFPLVLVVVVIVTAVVIREKLKAECFPKIIVPALSIKNPHQIILQPEIVRTLTLKSLEPIVRSTLQIQQEELKAKNYNPENLSQDLHCCIGQLDLKETSSSQQLLDAQDLSDADLSESGEYSGHVESENLELVRDAVIPSGYDRPQVLLEVELSDGDIVEGYNSSVI